MSEKPPLALINGPKLPQGNRWAMVYRTRSVLTGWLSASNIADARYWAVADIPSVAFDVAFGGKAGMAMHWKCPLLTQSGHV